jgi:hypothetical protein
MAPRTRIRATDKLGNVAYVYGQGPDWRCALANGTGAAFSYAGLGYDEMAVKFAFEDCTSSAEIVAVCQRFGGKNTNYNLV